MVGRSGCRPTAGGVERLGGAGDLFFAAVPCVLRPWGIGGGGGGGGPAAAPGGGACLRNGLRGNSFIF
uniref:Uncharacterized protein n=1 Tax=Oryza punctata TaxID=4537 RepID=A0A0E0JQ24_ORYPU